MDYGTGMGRPVLYIVERARCRESYHNGCVRYWNFKRQISGIIHPWYAEDARALGMFVILETYFDSLTLQGPGRRYHPNPTKSVMIVFPKNLEAREVFRQCHKFRVCTGARYLGGCFGDNESKRNWLRKRTLTWYKNINTIRKTAGKYP